jgi:guanosine-3',5'-bis(diphosphate) 3'-pyrophosphohydrolase
MRTLHFLPSAEKRARKARETMEIYVPLAQRIGVHKMKDELEDLAFRELNPDARDSILARLKFLREEDEDSVNFITHELMSIFEANDMQVQISGREKSPYSIWRKMRQKNVTFEQLSDIIAFRVIVKDVTECYQALGYLHGAYSVIPGRFKDYISTPKTNNYQSLHTTVIGPRGHRVEIQIRTNDMHEVNDYGVAAHWLYKQGSQKDESTQQYKWLRGLLDILENASDPEEFLENTKLEMFQDHVFCFSPKGDLISLPSGATPIDFAYAVHSAVGNHCVGAKINGRMVPLRTILHNGDQVEITTSKAQAPSPTWERYAVTGKARSAIRRYIRTQKRSQFVELGQSIIQKTFKAEKLLFDEATLQESLPKLGCKTIEDLYAVLGEGQRTVSEVIRVLYPERISKEKRIKSQEDWSDKKSKHEGSISIRGLIPGMAIHYAGCCHPLPGDKIVGIVITGRGVTIHTDDCETLQRYADEPDRWLDVTWSDDPGLADKYTARLRITIYNKLGSLANLTTLIGKNAGNILNLKITHRTELFFDVIIDVEVTDISHLNNIIGALRSSSHISSVERTRG